MITPGRQHVRLRFFSPDGEELDTVIIYAEGNCASIPGRTAWVEVTTIDDPEP